MLPETYGYTGYTYYAVVKYEFEIDLCIDIWYIDISIYGREIFQSEN